MAISASSRDDELQDDTLASPLLGTPNGSHDRKNMSARSLRDQFNAANVDTLENSIEPYQLPSPEPSPSPRSSSPSLISTGTPPIDIIRKKGLSNGHGRSSSFEHNAQEQEDASSNGIGIVSPKPISKRLPPHELHDIPEERPRHSRKHSMSKSPVDDKIRKLSPSQIQELTRAPESLPLPLSARLVLPEFDAIGTPIDGSLDGKRPGRLIENDRERALSPRGTRPIVSNRGYSTPATSRQDPSWPPKSYKTPTINDTTSARNLAAIVDTNGRRRAESRPEPLNSTSGKSTNARPHAKSVTAPTPEPQPSPIVQDLPLPPMSIPTYLQLELASSRPSPLYIHRSSANEYPYESSRIKFERLLNFLLLPPQLEQVLLFGSLACLDAWLHTFTILPLRFVKAIIILLKWWAMILVREARFIAGFIYHGSGRFWHRQRGRGDSIDSGPASRSASRASRPAVSSTTSYQSPQHTDSEYSSVAHAERLRTELQRKPRSTWGRRHKRTKSQPSMLSSYHKADLLQGLVIISSCLLLMMFDASRMYHSIRGQSAVKLYMIWNVIEVCLENTNCTSTHMT